MTEIVADRVQFGPRNSGGEGSSASANNNSGASNNQSGAPKLPDYPEEEINPEDIPF